MQCNMCNIINHEATLIYHDNLIICSLNYEPLKQPHLMILPKRHIEELNKLEAKELKAMFDLLHKLKNLIKTNFNHDVLIGMNTGKLATEPHIHFHILPYTTGIRGMFAKAEGSPHRKRLTDKELKPLRDKIKSLLN